MPPTITRGSTHIEQTESYEERPVIVLQPGSRNVRIGLAAESRPHTVPHCIARRHKLPGKQAHYEDPWLVRPECQQPNSVSQMKSGSKLAEDAILARAKFINQLRPTSQHLKQVSILNAQYHGEITDIPSKRRWTDTAHRPEILIGEEALYVDPSSPYNLHWPIKHGRLNLHSSRSQGSHPGKPRDGSHAVRSREGSHSGKSQRSQLAPGGSPTAIEEDLTAIWTYLVEKKMGIPLKELKNYRCVCLIPDIFCHATLKIFMEVLLTRLGFGAAILHQESVCAVLGSGVSCACVVDAGDQKTSVCCVDDGISIRQTRLRMDYGGSDVARVFLWLLTRVNFPYKECDLARRMDALLLTDLKDQYCSLSMNLTSPSQRHFQVNYPGSTLRMYTLWLADERIIAPMAYFFPELFGISGKLTHEQRSAGVGDSGDVYDQFYLNHSTVSASLIRKREEPSQTPDSDAISLTETDEGAPTGPLSPTGRTRGDSVTRGPRSGSPEGVRKNLPLYGLDEAIWESIERCGCEDMKKRLLRQIVVVGGGLIHDGTAEWVHYRLRSRLPHQLVLDPDAIHVITRPRGEDPRVTSWRGGAILSRLESCQDLWIRQHEWKRDGVKILRERAPFVW